MINRLVVWKERLNFFNHVVLGRKAMISSIAKIPTIRFRIFRRLRIIFKYLSYEQKDDWQLKKEFLEQFTLNKNQGLWCRKNKLVDFNERFLSKRSLAVNFNKIHYGCGSNRMDGWLNVDYYRLSSPNYIKIDLMERQPFPDACFDFAFCEDLLEHFNQSEAIFFMKEVQRCLKPKGVFRLSFPCLENILIRHYTPASDEFIMRGELESYTIWDHKHFFSQRDIELVAKHIGFNRIESVNFGKSDHKELVSCDTRSSQIGLNFYVELTK